MIKAILTTVIVAFIAACGAAPATTPKVVVTVSADPQTALLQAINASHSTFPLRLSIQDGETKFVIEYASKSKTRVVATVKAGAAEYLAIDADMYIKIGAGKWTHDVKGNLAEVTKQNPASELHDAASLIQHVRETAVTAKGAAKRGEQAVLRFESLSKAGELLILDIDPTSGRLAALDGKAGDFSGKWVWEFPADIKKIEAPAL